MIRSRWFGGGHDKSFINIPTARPVSHKPVLSMTVLGKCRLSVNDVRTDVSRVTYRQSRTYLRGQGDYQVGRPSLGILMSPTRMSTSHVMVL
jgi:hypothetical protein